MPRLRLYMVFISFLFTSILFANEPKNPSSQTYTIGEGISFKMIRIPGTNFSIGETEVTQEIYEAVTEENPSTFTGENMPVDTVNWYDAILFCNKLSVLLGKKPVYSVNGSPNWEEWNYTPHAGGAILDEIEVDSSADGFRLPTEKEWETAAGGGENKEYAGSKNLDEIAWFKKNSGYTSHEVAQKKPNGYGLYDMSGNLWEWCQDKYIEDSNNFRIKKGGCHSSDPKICEIKFTGHHYGSRYQPCYSYYTFGFRIAATETGN